MEELTSTFVTYTIEIETNVEETEIVVESTEETLRSDVRYVSSYRAESPAFRYEVPEHELGNVEDVSIAFWFKWSFGYPDYVSVEDLKDTKNAGLMVASVSETDMHGENFGDRKLALEMKALSFGTTNYYPSTYIRSTNRPNVGKNAPVDKKSNDFDGAWVFFYFGHSRSRNEAFSYLKFPSGKV